MVKPPGTRRFLSLFFVVLGLAGFGALIILIFGRMTLTEFAPSTFKRRSFTYFQIPLINQQITPTVRSDDSTALERYLRGANLVRVSVNANARWDVISVGTEDGAAEILTTYMDILEGTPLQDWSKAHPEMAQCLWAAVQEAAELQAYELTPDLFEMASSATDAQVFCRQINQWLITSYDELAADYREQSDEERATALEKAAQQRRQSPPEFPKAASEGDTATSPTEAEVSGEQK